MDSIEKKFLFPHSDFTECYTKYITKINENILNITSKDEHNNKHSRFPFC
jgi:hypothetical protein